MTSGKLFRLALAGASLLWANALLAQDPAPSGDDAQVAAAIFDDGLKAIKSHSLKGEQGADVIRKASAGLVAELTEIFQGLPELPAAGADETAVREAFLVQLKFLAEYPGQRYTLPELAELAIGAYCKSVDRYSRYYTRREFDAHLLSRKSSGAGVGMTLQEFNGDYFCYPYPGGSAESSGIKGGDMLMAVDGTSVKGKSLLTVASQIRGTPGTEVTLKVSRTYGRSTNVQILREALTVPAVVVEESFAGLIFKVRKITPQTVAEMKEALTRSGGAGSLTVDLRGCPGGEVTAARELAGLFLPQGATVFHEEVLGRRTPVKNENAPLFTPTQIVLMQDSGTASAAEILIASLIENLPARAVSQGEKSFGKGVIQEQVRLSGGGQLEITTGRVYSPSGKFWDGHGLQPSLTNNGQIFPPGTPTIGNVPAEAGSPQTPPAGSAQAAPANPGQPNQSPAEAAAEDAGIQIQVIGRGQGNMGGGAK
jgi:carboxyl-terminal processing protease